MSRGVVFLILGIGSFILPFFGVQFMLIDIFGRYSWIASIISIILGIFLIVRDKNE